uniref:Serine protease n=1 Tax=Oscillatoriales cyanobacterium SpSt-418 TaxID=2282169 RepID=A0A7C3PH42_9CYAN
MSGQRNDHRIELKRLAKLRWNLPGGNVTYGSGYLVSPSVVLTAAHLVEGTEQVEIRLNPSAPQPLWQGGDVVWRGRTDKHDLEGIDLALVRLQTPTALLGIVHFAHLGSGITSHSCRGTGFPDYKLRSASSPDASDIRDTAQLEGELRLGSNVAVGQWELQLAQNPLPAAPDATSPWPGISGSAVFVGKCVVGVVIIHPQQEGTTVLQVQPIYPVLSHPEFCQHLTGEARSLYWSDPWGLLRSPYQDLPEVAEQSAAVLLQPEIGVVPFEGRQAELKSLQTWLTGDPSFRLWLQLGSGGSGKTRLISEFADWAGRRGWLSGWLPTPNEPFSLTDLQPHLASGLPLLLLLDEAHWRKTDELVSLLKQLTGENSGEKCRLVFVARTDHDWWEQLKQSTVDAIPTLLAVEGAFKHTLQSLVPYHQDQLEAYKHALTAFAQTLGKCPSAQACPTLLTDDYQSILVVQAEALLTLLEGPKAVKGRNSVWERLLSRERNYWVQRKGAIAALLIDRDSDLSALVALASLTSAHNREEGERVLHSLPCLEDASRHDLRKVDYWLQTLYPGQEHWSPLKPDRLADTLLAEQLTKSEDFSKVRRL